MGCGAAVSFAIAVVRRRPVAVLPVNDSATCRARSRLRRRILGAHYAIFDRWHQIRVAPARRGSLLQITLGILLGLTEYRPA